MTAQVYLDSQLVGSIGGSAGAAGTNGAAAASSSQQRGGQQPKDVGARDGWLLPACADDAGLRPCLSPRLLSAAARARS
jgi:hypothetical protein